jgi:hypothetical protein
VVWNCVYLWISLHFLYWSSTFWSLGSIHFHTLVTRHRAWIHNWIYWALITTTNAYNSLANSHTQSLLNLSSLAVVRLQLPYSCPYWLATVSQWNNDCNSLHWLTSKSRYNWWSVSLQLVGQSVKLLQAFASTVIPSFTLLQIHDQDFYSLLHMNLFRNEAFSSTKEGSVILCRHYVYCTIVSAHVYPRCRGVQVNMNSVHPLSLHYTKQHLCKVDRGFLSMTGLVQQVMP